MKTKSLILLILICIMGVACKNANDTTCYFLPLAPPLTPVNLKFINKTTGADLIFGPGAPYKLSDLQATSSLPGFNPILRVDSSQKNNPYVVMVLTNLKTQTLTLTLGSLPADSIKAVFTTTQRSACYTSVDLSSIYLDGATVCSPCSLSVQWVTIVK